MNWTVFLMIWLTFASLIYACVGFFNGLENGFKGWNWVASIGGSFVFLTTIAAGVAMGGAS